MRAARRDCRACVCNLRSNDPPLLALAPFFFLHVPITPSIWHYYKTEKTERERHMTKEGRRPLSGLRVNMWTQVNAFECYVYKNGTLRRSLSLLLFPFFLLLYINIPSRTGALHLAGQACCCYSCCLFIFDEYYDRERERERENIKWKWTNFWLNESYLHGCLS